MGDRPRAAASSKDGSAPPALRIRLGRRNGIGIPIFLLLLLLLFVLFLPESDNRFQVCRSDEAKGYDARYDAISLFISLSLLTRQLRYKSMAVVQAMKSTTSNQTAGRILTIAQRLWRNFELMIFPTEKLGRRADVPATSWMLTRSTQRT